MAALANDLNTAEARAPIFELVRALEYRDGSGAVSTRRTARPFRRC